MTVLFDVDFSGFGLPLAVPLQGASSEEGERKAESKPRSATQLYREIDRLMTTVVRGVEVRGQQRD